MEPTATIVRQYISDAGLTGGGKHSYPLFPNRHGERLTRAGIKYILDKCVEPARNKNPGVLPEVISPHSFRHYLPFLTMSCNAAATALFLVKS
jgi:site-specific recombinase XerD